MTTTRPRIAADQACLEAVDLAREAALDVAGPDGVGEHLGADADDERVVTHSFRCLDPGYVGWRWAVTVSRAARARLVTVAEVVLLPDEGALLAPEWVPWSERLQPGDLGVGDLLPTAEDDDRLVPAYADEDLGDHDVEALAFEFGLGRKRVLSRIGRDDATDRWYAGSGGPAAPIAQSAPGRCGKCGFYWPLGGSLHTVFGVCGNEYAPDDGHVVSADHGCGAHSEAVVAPPAPSTHGSIVDDYAVEVVAVRPPADNGEALGHS